MIIRITAVIIGLLVLLMSFRSEWILRNIIKIDEPSDKQILTLKSAALAAAVILFIVVTVILKI
ncbi:MAG: hypothetical protein PUF72_05095 [Clostridiales bacterium]|nr:hypothetical protein [Clostridiales bacterium]